MHDEMLSKMGKRRVVWVGGYPAHYTRKFHLALERSFPSKFVFIYLYNSNQQASQRAYEEGGVPQSSIILPSDIDTFALIRVLRTLSPSALVASGNYPRKLVFASLWGFATRRPVLYQSDTNLLDYLRMPLPLRWLRKLLMRPFLGRMYKLLYIGTRNRDYFVQLLGRQASSNKFSRLPYPHDATAFEGVAARNGVSPGTKIRFLYLGRLAPEKAVDQLLHAFAIIPSNLRERAELVIAGDGTEKSKLLTLASRLGINDCVYFLGAVPSNSARDVFANADVYVLPSDKEPWGLVVNEALSSAKPVIAPFWVGAVTDLVVDGYNGIVTGDNSAAELSKAMSFFIHNPSSALEMGKRGRELVRQAGYTADACIKNVGDLLTELERPRS